MDDKEDHYTEREIKDSYISPGIMARVVVHYYLFTYTPRLGKKSSEDQKIMFSMEGTSHNVEIENAED